LSLQKELFFSSFFSSFVFGSFKSLANPVLLFAYYVMGLVLLFLHSSYLKVISERASLAEKKY